MQGPQAVHDAAAIRRGGRDLLSLALIDARNRLLRWLDAFDACEPPPSEEFDPPDWVAGHVAWQQEYWIARNVTRAHGSAPPRSNVRLPSIDTAADAAYDPTQVPRAARWQAQWPEPQALRGYLLQTLETTLDLLARAPETDESLYFFRAALAAEDLAAEALATQIQALAQKPPPEPLELPMPARPMREPLWFPAQRWTLGTAGPGHVPDTERGQESVDVPEFEIDAQPVCWAQYVEFIDDGGYDDPRWWDAAGRDWLAATGRRVPRYVEQSRGGVTVRRDARLQRVPAQQSVMHVSLHEALAWCRWAGRRLATEVEWEIAARRGGAARGFVWGDVLEWTAGRARLFDGAEPGPAFDPATIAAGARVVRGASWRTPQRLVHPCARRFRPPAHDGAFIGFRSCAIG